MSAIASFFHRHTTQENLVPGLYCFENENKKLAKRLRKLVIFLPVSPINTLHTKISFPDFKNLFRLRTRRKTGKMAKLIKTRKKKGLSKKTTNEQV